MSRRCSVDGCERPFYARGVCAAHYKRSRRTGTVRADVPVGSRAEPRACLVDSCSAGATERGLCHAHYLRLIRLGHVGADRPVGRRVNGVCTVPACGRAATAHGLCRAHRNRQRRDGDVDAFRPVRISGGAGHVCHGYRIVPVPPRFRHLADDPARGMAEHRLVMAVMLGRRLRPDESVHHRNGDRLDNSPANLELWSRWQPRGQRVADKVEWALALLRRYHPASLRSDVE